MNTIEKARENLADHLATHCRPGSHPQAECCLPLADAYALATSEHSRMIPGWYEGHESDEGLRQNMEDEYDRLRDKIGASA